MSGETCPLLGCNAPVIDSDEVDIPTVGYPYRVTTEVTCAEDHTRLL